MKDILLLDTWTSLELNSTIHFIGIFALYSNVVSLFLAYKVFYYYRLKRYITTYVIKHIEKNSWIWTMYPKKIVVLDFIIKIRCFSWEKKLKNKDIIRK